MNVDSAGLSITTPPATAGRPAVNTLAVGALALALVGLCLGLTAPAGAIMGHVAYRRIKASGGRGDRLALAAIVVGWIGTAGAVAMIITVMTMLPSRT